MGRKRIELLGLAGSLREGSLNRGLIRAAGEMAPEDVRWRSYRGLARVPPYNQDEDTDPAPPAVAELRGAIGRADALLVATPEYNRSVPGVLKNAVDWASRPYRESVLAGLPVAVVGASPGRHGARRAQEDLRRVLEACGSEVLDAGLAVSRARERFEGGELADAAVRRELREVVESLARAVRPGRERQSQTARAASKTPPTSRAPAAPAKKTNPPATRSTKPRDSASR